MSLRTAHFLWDFTKEQFYDILTVTGCRNIDEDYSKILKITVDYLMKETSFYHK